MFYGWIAGFILSIFSAIIASRRDYARGLVAALIVPLVATFIGASIIYSVMLSPKKRVEQQYAELLNEVKTYPETLHRLLCDARNRPLSDSERAVVWQMVWVNRAIPDEYILFLLDYFEHDGSALAGIMKNQNITVEQLRYLYEKHKNPTEYSRVLDELSKHPLTPPDVLEALTTQHDPFVAQKARERLAAHK